MNPKKLINGWHHKVYVSGNTVTKVPRRLFGYVFSETTHLKEDLDLLDRYFPGLAVPTEVKQSSDHGRVIVQQYIRDADLLTSQMSEQVRKQLRSILIKNNSMIAREGKSIDFLGGKGISSCISYLFTHKPLHLSNMLVMHTSQQVVLVDTELLRLRLEVSSFHGLISFISSWISFWLCKWFLWLFFKLPTPGVG